jgi:hypothetical protein
VKEPTRPRPSAGNGSEKEHLTSRPSCRSIIRRDPKLSPSGTIQHSTRGISSINKLPPPPIFPSCRWAEFVGIIVSIAAEAIFVAIVMLARIKTILWASNALFLLALRPGRRRGFTDWNDVIIDHVLIVAARVVIELACRHLCPLSLAPGLYPNGREN